MVSAGGGGPAAGTICLEKMTDEVLWLWAAAAVLAVARAMLEASGILMVVALTSLLLLVLLLPGGSTRFMVFRSRPRRSLSQGIAAVHFYMFYSQKIVFFLNKHF